MLKIEHEWYDMIIGRYDINMTYFSFIMSYRDQSHLVKVSQNQKSFDLRNSHLPKVPDLKNYLIWTGLTDSEQKKLWDPANAYFSIWGISPGWLEKFDQVRVEVS